MKFFAKKLSLQAFKNPISVSLCIFLLEDCVSDHTWLISSRHNGSMDVCRLTVVGAWDLAVEGTSLADPTVWVPGWVLPTMQLWVAMLVDTPVGTTIGDRTNFRPGWPNRKSRTD